MSFLNYEISPTVRAELALLKDRVDKLSNQIKYEIEPNQKITLYTGKSGAIQGPYGLTYGELTNEIPLAAAIQKLADHLGLEFKHVPYVPQRVELTPKEPKP